MRKKKPVVALCYDFDGTLAPGNMQEYGFFPGLGNKDPEEFWKQSAALAKQNGANQILAYMQLMLEKAKESKQNRYSFEDDSESHSGIRQEHQAFSGG